MKTIIKKKITISEKDNLIILTNKISNISDFNLSDSEISHIKKEIKDDKEIITINQYSRIVTIVSPKKEKDNNQYSENIRLLGDKLLSTFSSEKSVLIIDVDNNSNNTFLLAEGLALSNYTFTKHKTEPKANKLETIYMCKNSNQSDLNELQPDCSGNHFPGSPHRG